MDEAQLEERIMHLVNTAKAAAQDLKTGGTAVGRHYDRLDQARSAAAKYGGDVQLSSTEVMNEWHNAEHDLQTHCDAIEAHTLAAAVARQREDNAWAAEETLEEKDFEDAVNLCGALEMSANSLVRYHAMELHRLVLALHALSTQAEPPTVEQIRAARADRVLYDHSLPGEEA